MDVRRQARLGKLFGEFGMNVDVVIHTDDESYLLDTKYKVIEEVKRHGNLSQSDFYQMFGYLRAGDDSYDNVILLYPKTDVSPDDSEFENGDGANLFVRTVDVVKCYDEGGNILTGEMLGELERVFRGIGVRKGVVA